MVREDVHHRDNLVNERSERSAGGNSEIVGVVAPILGDTTWRASQGMYPEKQDHMCNITGYMEVCGGDK